MNDSSTEAGGGMIQPSRKMCTLMLLRPLAVLVIAAMLSTTSTLAETETADPVRTVTVIDRTDIELSGHTSLSELLTSRLQFNSLGLRGARFGTSSAIPSFSPKLVGVPSATATRASLRRARPTGVDHGPR